MATKLLVKEDCVELVFDQDESPLSGELDIKISTAGPAREDAEYQALYGYLYWFEEYVFNPGRVAIYDFNKNLITSFDVLIDLILRGEPIYIGSEALEEVPALQAA